MKLPELCKVLNEKLQAANEQVKVLGISSLALQQAFKVKEDEVAFLKPTDCGEYLKFLWPEKLSKAGQIPLSTKDSLAVVTFRDNTSKLHNRFSSTHHSAIFEQVPLHNKVKKDDSNKGEQVRPRSIQKIMSAPLVNDIDLIGVVQVSRKGDDPKTAGPDFSDLELEALTEISKVIGKHL